jgi:ferredoxin
VPHLPPSTVSGERFAALCVRCGNCIKSCPSGMIRHRHPTDNLAMLFTPELDFEQGYCLPDCCNCGKVCPSGAIVPFKVKDKKRLVIGKAHLNTADCLLQQYRECDRCVAFCSYDAVKIVTGESLMDAFPKVIDELCAGCGACLHVCPEKCFKITMS